MPCGKCMVCKRKQLRQKHTVVQVAKASGNLCPCYLRFVGPTRRCGVTGNSCLRLLIEALDFPQGIRIPPLSGKFGLFTFACWKEESGLATHSAVWFTWQQLFILACLPARRGQRSVSREICKWRVNLGMLCAPATSTRHVEILELCLLPKITGCGIVLPGEYYDNQRIGKK